jgi:hypothetical protein
MSILKGTLYYVSDVHRLPIKHTLNFIATDCYEINSCHSQGITVICLHRLDVHW